MLSVAIVSRVGIYIQRAVQPEGQNGLRRNVDVFTAGGYGGARSGRAAGDSAYRGAFTASRDGSEQSSEQSSPNRISAGSPWAGQGVPLRNWGRHPLNSGGSSR